MGAVPVFHSQDIGLNFRTKNTRPRLAGGSIIFEHRAHDWLGNAWIQQVHQGVAFVSASNCSSPAHAPCHRQEQRLIIIITILGKRSLFRSARL